MMISNDEKIVCKEALAIASDCAWHDFYELNSKYRVSPERALSAINFLKQRNLITLDGLKFRLSYPLSDAQMADMNYISKTSKPDVLSHHAYAQKKSRS